MFSRFIQVGLVFLALVVQVVAACPVQSLKQGAIVKPLTSAAFATVAAPAAGPQDADPQLDEPESRSQHAARVNRNLMVATSSILSLFVLCRIVLLWQIARHRKKLARENLLETKA